MARWLVSMVLFALLWPASSAADHLTTTASVSARVVERRAPDLWTVEISWTAACVRLRSCERIVRPARRAAR